MTSNEPEVTPASTDEEVQQIPAVNQVQVAPAATDARDALLAAIGAEAQLVGEKSAGQASAALVELARAYALVAAGPAATPQPVGAARMLQIYPENYIEPSLR